MAKLLLPTLIDHRGGKTLLKFIIFLHLDHDIKTVYPVLLCCNFALKSVGVSSLLEPTCISSNYM